MTQTTTNRVTVTLSDEMMAKLREIQAYVIRETGNTASFSQIYETCASVTLENMQLGKRAVLRRWPKK